MLGEGERVNRVEEWKGVAKNDWGILLLLLLLLPLPVVVLAVVSRNDGKTREQTVTACFLSSLSGVRRAKNIDSNENLPSSIMRVSDIVEVNID